MKRKSIMTLLTVSMICLSACGNKNDATLPVNAEPMPEVTEAEDEPESIQEEEPEQEPIEEEEEPEEDEDKPLDLDSLDNLKWIMEALATLERNSASSYVRDLYSGEENAIITMLWYMDYCGVENPKGEDVRIGDDENGWDGYVRFTIEQAQEIINSLTGQQIDISSVGENGVIDVSPIGMIESLSEYKNWNTEYIGDNIWKIYVDEYNVFDSRFDDDSSYKISEIIFTVTENPDSIFDGYSIIEVEEEAPKMPEWAKAYYDYLLEKSHQPYYDRENYKCSFIYADSDDIPELYVQEDTWCSLLYYSDGQVKEKNFPISGNHWYIPQSGLLMEDYSEYGNISTTVYQFINGEITSITEGYAEFQDVYMDENGMENWIYDYMFNGEPVSEEEYNRRLNEVFDSSKAIEPWRDEGESLNSILDKLSSQ